MRFALAKLLYLVAFASLVVLVGCGGDESGSRSVAVESGQRSERIEKLERRVERLRRDRARSERDRQSQPADRGAGAGAKDASAPADRARSGNAALAGDLASFISNLPGSAGVALGVPGAENASGSIVTAGDLESGSAWSTIKVAIAQRTLVDAGRPDRLSTNQSNLIRRALQLSDNDAAAALFAALEKRHGGLTGAAQAVEEMLRQADDRQTTVSTNDRDGFSTYGQTDWRLADQFTYMSTLEADRAAGDTTASYLFDVMSGVAGSDTFGLGAIATPARWKGGWGPGPDGRYLVRQMGILETPGGNLVVAMAAIADDGSFESGAAILSEIATWIENHQTSFVN